MNGAGAVTLPEGTSLAPPGRGGSGELAAVLIEVTLTTDLTTAETNALSRYRRSTGQERRTVARPHEPRYARRRFAALRFHGAVAVDLRGTDVDPNRSLHDQVADELWRAIRDQQVDVIVLADAAGPPGAMIALLDLRAVGQRVRIVDEQLRELRRTLPLGRLRWVRASPAHDRGAGIASLADETAQSQRDHRADVLAFASLLAVGAVALVASRLLGLHMVVPVVTFGIVLQGRRMRALTELRSDHAS